MPIDKSRVEAVNKKTKLVIDKKFDAAAMAVEVDKIIESAYGKGTVVPASERQQLMKLIADKFK